MKTGRLKTRIAPAIAEISNIEAVHFGGKMSFHDLFRGSSVTCMDRGPTLKA